MIRALRQAIHDYRQAEEAGDEDAITAAREKSDRLLKEHLFRSWRRWRNPRTGGALYHCNCYKYAHALSEHPRFGIDLGKAEGLQDGWSHV